MDTDMKKAYLRQYMDCDRSIRRIEEEIRREQEAAVMRSHISDGQPHGMTVDRDLSDAMAKIYELIERLREEVKRKMWIREQVGNTIESLEIEKEKDVLFYHYILGFTWDRVAVEMSVDVRWVHRLHGRALQNLKVPKWYEKRYEKTKTSH